MSDFETQFEFIWTNFVTPIIKRSAAEMSKEFIEQCDLAYSFNNFSEYKHKIITFYKEKREWLKTVYMPHEKSPNLDAHKLGGVLCRSLIANKPFYMNTESVERYVSEKFSNDKSNHTEWFVDNVFVNYKVAFYASLGYVYTDLLGSYRQSNKKEHYKELNNNGTLFFYNNSDSHESFENSTILALQKNDILNRDFDYLSYAILLFQLEKHTEYICDNIVPSKNAKHT